MSNRLTRQAFLGAASLALFVPTKLFADDNSNEVVLRFAALSDVHFDRNHTAQSNERVRFAAALRAANVYASSRKYPKLDAIVAAGDFSNHGVKEELLPFRDVMNENLSPETRRVLCMGNHEYYGGNRALWEEIFQTQANAHYEINGYHFIAISPEKGTCDEGDYLYVKEWLDQEIQNAIRADSSKPVFVVQHYHPYRTVFGSYDLPGDFHAGVRDLLDTLNKYPQVVHISGHSHYPSMEPRSIWQGGFTCVGTGSLSYFALHTFERERNFLFGDDVNERIAGTFLIFDVYQDNTIRIKLYDVISESFWDREYLIVDPLNVDKYVYTDRRYDLAAPARWKNDAKFEALDVKSTAVAIRCNQAEDDACVVSYRIDVEKRDEDSWKKVATHNFWSDFFMKEQSQEIAFDILGLEPETRYQLKIFACGAFQKETVEPLSIEIDTPGDDQVDKNARTPDADVLDIAFDVERGLCVKPEIFSSRAIVLPKEGTFKIVDDPILGPGASFNGLDQAYLLPYSPIQVSDVKNQISIGARFRLEADRIQSKERVSIFGSTESGGLGFEYDRNKEMLIARLWIDKAYQDLSAPFPMNKEAALYLTFDGTIARLFIDGTIVAEKKCSGAFRFTDNASARAFCLGGDVNPGMTARWFFPGIVSYARVFSWGLSPEQVAALSRR